MKDNVIRLWKNMDHQIYRDRHCKFEYIRIDSARHCASDCICRFVITRRNICTVFVIMHLASRLNFESDSYKIDVEKFSQVPRHSTDFNDEYRVSWLIIYDCSYDNDVKRIKTEYKRFLILHVRLSLEVCNCKDEGTTFYHQSTSVSKKYHPSPDTNHVYISLTSFTSWISIFSSIFVYSFSDEESSTFPVKHLDESLNLMCRRTESSRNRVTSSVTVIMRKSGKVRDLDVLVVTRLPKIVSIM